jgi:hypothetical protein
MEHYGGGWGGGELTMWGERKGNNQSSLLFVGRAEVNYQSNSMIVGH